MYDVASIKPETQKTFWKAAENWNQSNWNYHLREEEING